MKYSKAEKEIEKNLEDVFGNEWGKHYRIETNEDFFQLLRRDDEDEPFKIVAQCPTDEMGEFYVKDLSIIRGVEIATIFAELALTLPTLRGEKHKYVVKVGDMGLSTNEHSMYLGISKSLFKKHVVFSSIENIDQFKYNYIFSQAQIDRLKNTGALSLDWDKAVKAYDGQF